MVSGAHARTDASEHYDLDLLVGQETVPENHGELGLSEWDVLALRALALLRVKCSDAFLEAEKGLVDLSTLGLSIPVVALAVLGSFGTGKVNE